MKYTFKRLEAHMLVRLVICIAVLFLGTVIIASLSSTTPNPQAMGVSSAETNSNLQTPMPTATLSAPTPTGTAKPMPNATRDPAMRIPGIAAFAAQFPTDWEQRLHPGIRNMVVFQRMIGEHATVVGFSDEEPNPGYLNPKVLVAVTDWDRTDLFTAGVVRFYNGKPVEIMFLEGPPVAIPLTIPPTLTDSVSK